ncbi:MULTISPECIES: hypothetical protein [unclassified Nitratiruptor]|uniref:hypothetical protein n=1 Tax=unclassified Nitratiruptor TaxID=2624044 RepID=UPI0019152017|nr:MULTISPECIES: hypothetical protein [unclassified Nitratiruptor]BCD59583.1 hypothetical protein NitYY0810_C0334 [Nitratiruptor sp. YY08-10]BCD63507.1 hypothetical protein NitYY0814_C0334 [Nitratiruptor sp. YY08-14]BCD83059.1 hypothetical protein NrS2_09 [Nitratiruptor phage NrS-2]BCD83125.1 hypothetical protein NrS3_09 [Nitratiruptor phage NrS-3]
MPTLDELYGKSLDEYFERLDSEIDWERVAKEKSRYFVPAKNEIEIKMLQEAYDELAAKNEELNEYGLQLAINRRQAIVKKRKHLERLKKWNKSL